MQPNPKSLQGHFSGKSWKRRHRLAGWKRVWSLWQDVTVGHVEDERLLFDPKCKSLNTQTVCLIGRHSSVSTPIIRNDLETSQEVVHASDFGYLKHSTLTIPSFFKKMLCNSQENCLTSEVIFHPTPCVPASEAFLLTHQMESFLQPYARRSQMDHL